MSSRFVQLAAWLASAALCFGTCVIPNPVKKKGAGPLFKIHYGDKWGFMDRTGKIVIQPQFSGVGDFFDGLARVTVKAEKDYRTCFIDATGKTVIPCIFDGALDFSEGLAPVQMGRQWGYIDQAGKVVIPPQFQGAAEIHDGLGRFMVWERLQCIGRTYTKNDAPPYYFSMHDDLFLATTACFADHPRFGYVDKSGRVAIKPGFFVAEDFSEGLATVRIEESAASKYAFIDQTGSVVIPPHFDQAYSFSEGLAAVETGSRIEGKQVVGGKWGFIDHAGKFVISPRFDFTSKFSEGLAGAFDDLLGWGYADRTGRFVIAPKYSQGTDFSEGLAVAWRLGGSFYIDRKGKRVLKLKGGGWGFSDGFTIAGEEGKPMYVDRNGRKVAPYEVKPGY